MAARFRFLARFVAVAALAAGAGGASLPLSALRGADPRQELAASISSPARLRAVAPAAARSGAGTMGQKPTQDPPQKPTQDPPQKPPADQAPQPQRPTFRAGVNFVRVDIIVTDRQGNPVRDLAQADFEVSEDGKPQAVETFKYVEVKPPSVTGEAVRPIRTVGDQEEEAARDDVRLVAIFLDDYHVRRSSAMASRSHLSDFIAKQLAPTDMVAVMYPLTPVTDLLFTRDHEATTRAIERFEGRKYDYRPRNQFEERYAFYPASTVERVRNQVSFSALAGLAVHMGTIREGRKAILLVSEGYTNFLPPQLNDPVASMPGVGNPARGRPSLGEPSSQDDYRQFMASVDLQNDMREVFDAANRNNAAIYAVDPRGLAVFEFDINEGVEPRTDRKMLDSTIDTLRSLAAETDGRAIVNRNDLEGGLRQLVRDSSAYYLIGYNSSQAPADGKFHEIKVRVKRPGVQLRARRGYWAPTTADVERAAAPPKPDLPAPVQRALSTLVDPVRGRFIRHWVGTSRGEEGRTRVTFVWEAPPAVPGVERAAASSVMLQAVGEEARPYFRGRVPDVVITDESAPEAARRGPFRVTFDVPPGALQLRIAVEGDDGRVIDADARQVAVPDLTVPQVALSTPAVLRAANARAFRLLAADPDAVPTASREFRRTERLLIRTWAYAPGDIVPEVTGRLLNRAGGAMVDVAVKGPSAPGGPHEIDLPLAGLVVGEYLLEVKATGEAGEAAELVAIRIVS